MVDRRGRRQDARTRLLRRIEAWETEIPVISTGPFSDEWPRIRTRGERIKCRGKTATAFVECERGADQGAGGSPPQAHPGGAVVVQDGIDEQLYQAGGISISARSSVNLEAGLGITLAVDDDLEADRAGITIALDLDSAMVTDALGFTPATSTHNHSGVYSPVGHTHNITPSAQRFSDVAFGDGYFSVNATCVAGERAIAGGYYTDKVDYRTIVYESYLNGTSQWHCAGYGFSGAWNTLRCYVVCIAYPHS